MIDLHTHLLPDWDDGAADRAESDRMIEVARQEGISKICLTPHIFRMTKHGDDGRDLKARMSDFIEKAKFHDIQLFPGAEVHIHPDMIGYIKEHGLTVNGSNYVFIEFPAQHVPGGATNLIFQLMLEGLIPIISHPERNTVFARSPNILYEMVRQGALGQVTAQSITGGFGPNVRKAAEVFMRHNLVHFIASDAHDTETRPPKLSEAVSKVAKILGAASAEAMVNEIPAAILENEQIPELGEPVSPLRRSKIYSRFR